MRMSWSKHTHVNVTVNIPLIYFYIYVFFHPALNLLVKETRGCSREEKTATPVRGRGCCSLKATLMKRFRVTLSSRLVDNISLEYNLSLNGLAQLQSPPAPRLLPLPPSIFFHSLVCLLPIFTAPSQLKPLPLALKLPTS